ncbi:hypothetical protein OKA04_06530 [Luteolibacter flavescens]|uniref:Uncharacterized protein n=1 Tax=Luteolibacter flavescens TaxID=1859460 RepID=A0ABT3FLB5_9BACT|nr:hypothetical protein [Luteolibacter flavescens]MCW1884381.1 hypothetical protein [Luteolibacter flavescens]
MISNPRLHLLARNHPMRGYPHDVTAEAILQKSVRYDRNGKPLEVVIPYEDFIDFVETYGLDLTSEEKDAIEGSRRDLAEKRNDNFVGLDEAKRQLGL